MLNRYRPLIPVLIMTACCISTLLFWLQGTATIEDTPVYYELNAKHYGAFAATGATLASFFLLRRYFKYFFALTFVLGFVGLLNFTIAEMSMGISFGPLRIGVSPALALIGFVTCLLYPQRIASKLAALIKPSDEKIAKVQREEIATFKTRFSRKTTEELAQIVAADALIPSALSAARELLRERQQL